MQEVDPPENGSNSLLLLETTKLFSSGLIAFWQFRLWIFFRHCSESALSLRKLINLESEEDFVEYQKAA